MARVDVYLEAFLAERCAAGLSPAGEAWFRQAWEAFRRLPGSYRPTDVVLVRSSGPDYRHGRALFRILSWMRDQGHLPRLRLFGPPKPPCVQSRPAMTWPEVEALLLAVDDIGVRTLAYLVYRTGLRAETLLRLTVEDFRPEVCMLILERDSKGRGSGVFLCPQAVEALKRWKLRRSRHVPFLLHDGQGRPLTLQRASQSLRAAGRRLGITTGFGHLQYAHVRLLARQLPEFSRHWIEFHMQQSFRLTYLRIPNLFDPDPPVTGTHHVLDLL